MSPRAKSLAALHPTDLAERGEEVARALKRLGHHDMALVVRELAKTVQQQHAAIAYLRTRIGLDLFIVCGFAAIRVDFQGGRADICHPAEVDKPGPKYVIRSRPRDLLPVAHGAMTWEDYTLTFRMRIHREPDIYQALVHAFLLIDPQSSGPYAERLLRSNAGAERIATTDEGGEPYAIDRYCPHQGADLSAAFPEGACIVCPRHRWRFDLSNGGSVVNDDGSHGPQSIHAEAIQK